MQNLGRTTKEKAQGRDDRRVHQKNQKQGRKGRQCGVTQNTAGGAKVQNGGSPRGPRSTIKKRTKGGRSVGDVERERPKPAKRRR